MNFKEKLIRSSYNLWPLLIPAGLYVIENLVNNSHINENLLYIILFSLILTAINFEVDKKNCE